MTEKTIWTKLKKLSGAALALLVLLLLCSTGYFYIQKKSDGIDIPNGMYMLTNPRPLRASDCNLSFKHFGVEITIEDDVAKTSAGDYLTYAIKKQGENTYNVGPALTTCEYKNGQLVFNCGGTFIVYQTR